MKNSEVNGAKRITQRNIHFLAKCNWLLLLVWLAACSPGGSVLVVRVVEPLPNLTVDGFESAYPVLQLKEEQLRQANHLLIWANPEQLPFDERAVIERYLEAGGRVSFACTDTIYNWGQLQPFLKSGQVAIRCDESELPLTRSTPNYRKARSPLKPETDRMVRTVLAAPLREPMALVVTEKSLVYWVERKGTINTWHPGTGEAREIDRLDVYTGEEDGLLGIVLDPNFEQNQWAYLFYSPPGPEPKQHISRFRLTPNGLDRASEKVILVVPTQRDECCHSAGDLEFDQAGNLYISTGDNTFSRDSDGFTPLDERPGRAAFDAQKSSPNTHDLRGKILRICPQADGTYTIPDGNLFPKDGSQGLPEIYIMGARNPFTIAIHRDKGWLYWGDVGPDGNVTSERGPSAHDEINFAKAPGYYGWPYFNANNLAYADYDFETGAIGPRFDPMAPKNTSVNNTGRVELPPAIPAMIYYTFAETRQFPGVGKGSRSTGVGEVYHLASRQRHGDEFPAYYDGKLFVFDWARDWIKVVSQDKEGNFLSIEPFLDQSVLASPIDMTFGPDGALYVLEYGIGYFTDNHDSKLIRIDFINGNRPPVAQASLSVTDGKVPLTVKLDAAGTTDPDAGDQLTYRWRVTGPQQIEQTGALAEVTLSEPGSYTITLLATDQRGATGIASTQVVAGNSRPELDIQLAGNQTFYWPGQPVAYEVMVKDAEDGSIGSGISADAVKVQLSRYTGSDNRAPAALSLLAQTDSKNLPAGLQIIQKSDCRSCHKINETSIGPSFHQIADRYDQDYLARDYLAGKIINGGSGVWGDGMMIAHPDITKEAAAAIVDYILSVNDPVTAPESEAVAVRGTIGTMAGSGESLRLEAHYTDRPANGLPAFTVASERTLRPPVWQAELADSVFGFLAKGAIADGDRRFLQKDRNDAWLKLDAVDLTGIAAIGVDYFFPEGYPEKEIAVELRLGSAKGAAVAKAILTNPGDGKRGLVKLTLKETGQYAVFLVMTASDPEFTIAIDELIFYP